MVKNEHVFNLTLRVLVQKNQEVLGGTGSFTVDGALASKTSASEASSKRLRDL